MLAAANRQGSRAGAGFWRWGACVGRVRGRLRRWQGMAGLPKGPAGAGRSADVWRRRSRGPRQQALQASLQVAGPSVSSHTRAQGQNNEGKICVGINVGANSSFYIK